MGRCLAADFLSPPNMGGHYGRLTEKCGHQLWRRLHPVFALEGLDMVIDRRRSDLEIVRDRFDRNAKDNGTGDDVLLVSECWMALGILIAHATTSIVPHARANMLPPLRPSEI
jgi:hypothetical protein